jgi:hypothetical protein
MGDALRAYVTVLSAALASLTVRLVRERMNPSRVNPPIVEVEQRAHRDDEVQDFVGPARCPNSIEITLRDRRRAGVHLVHESKERLVRLIERRGFQVGQDPLDEDRIAEEFRCNCSV